MFPCNLKSSIVYDTDRFEYKYLAPQNLKTALWFYAGLEGDGDISLTSEEDPLVSC